ncbi:MAG: hypothetical protein Q4E10_00375 [Porphyromonas sp.]|nr:hypothetical protein [Porphyromonas sp.]
MRNHEILLLFGAVSACVIAGGGKVLRLIAPLEYSWPAAILSAVLF